MLSPHDRLVLYHGTSTATCHRDVEVNVFHAVHLVVNVAGGRFCSCDTTLEPVTKKRPKPSHPPPKTFHANHCTYSKSRRLSIFRRQGNSSKGWSISSDSDNMIVMFTPSQADGIY